MAVRAGAAELATFVCRSSSDMTCSDDASVIALHCQGKLRGTRMLLTHCTMDQCPTVSLGPKPDVVRAYIDDSTCTVSIIYG